MARQSRYHLPGACYHVILRGNNQQVIFFDDFDRCKFCLLLQEGTERFGHHILAFCFMNNHLHLAIQVGEVPLSRIMQNVCFRYTRYINWKQDRVGHLFQGRYKSILIQEFGYLKELVRYIHLNPVRSGLVDQPEHFRWSSHRAYLGNSEFSWVSQSYLLSGFAENLLIAVKKFHNFVLAGVHAQELLNFENGRPSSAHSNKEHVHSENNTKASSCSVSELVQAACELYEIDVETLRKPSKSQREATIRGLLALLVQESPDLTLTELGSILHRGVSSLSQHARRVELKNFSSNELRQKTGLLRKYSRNVKM